MIDKVKHLKIKKWKLDTITKNIVATHPIVVIGIRNIMLIKEISYKKDPDLENVRLKDISMIKTSIDVITTK